LQRSLIKIAQPNLHGSPYRTAAAAQPPIDVSSDEERSERDMRIMRLEVYSNRRKLTNPNSRYIQKLKAKIDNEDRLV
jgi:hypothetical protein